MIIECLELFKQGQRFYFIGYHANFKVSYLS